MTQKLHRSQVGDEVDTSQDLIMEPVARALSEEDVTAVSAWLASLPFPVANDHRSIDAARSTSGHPTITCGNPHVAARLQARSLLPAAPAGRHQIHRNPDQARSKLPTCKSEQRLSRCRCCPVPQVRSRRTRTHRH